MSKMRLVDAIILGSTNSKQAFGQFEDLDGSRCTLGAALAAVGRPCVGLPRKIVKEVEKEWPHVMQMIGNFNCPACPQQHALLGSLIVHLNDQHFWSREKIAEYITQFEPDQPEAKPMPAPDAEAEPEPVTVPVQSPSTVDKLVHQLVSG
jgi:hypothetical protein